jgi:hypothetical protein
VLGAGERLYVPFVEVVTDECEFVFGEPGQYFVSAFAKEKVGWVGSFDGSARIAIDVYDWNLQDEWKVRALGCAPLLAFGIEPSLDSVADFQDQAAVGSMKPYLSGGKRTLQAIWRNDRLMVGQLFAEGMFATEGATPGVGMWNCFRTLDKSLKGMPVIVGGDYVVGF